MFMLERGELAWPAVILSLLALLLSLTLSRDSQIQDGGPLCPTEPRSRKCAQYSEPEG